MSREAWRWAFGLLAELPVDQGMVLLYVAEQADLTGVYFTRLETIAEATDRTADEVKRCLGDLARTGYLTVEPLPSRGLWWIELKRRA
jgi:hypothetical protein